MGRLKVTKQSKTGRNLQFKDTKTGRSYTRAQACKAIESGRIPGYHVAKHNGLKTPKSNPDGSKNNNLG